VNIASLLQYSLIVSVSIDPLVCNTRAGISVILYICTQKAPVQIFFQIPVVLSEGGFSLNP
jgi:hypothetical protein